MMMVWNGPLGPRDSFEWDSAITQCFSVIKKKFSPGTAPLFANSAPLIMKDLTMQRIMLPAERDPEFELWDYIFARGLARPANGKVNTCRFQGAVHVADANLDFWWVDRFVRTASLYVVFDLVLFVGVGLKLLFTKYNISITHC